MLVQKKTSKADGKQQAVSHVFVQLVVKLVNSQCRIAWTVSSPVLFRECCSRCRFQPYDCVIIHFVE